MLMEAQDRPIIDLGAVAYGLNRQQEQGAVKRWNIIAFEKVPEFLIEFPFGEVYRFSLGATFAFLQGIRAERQRVELRRMEGTI